MYVVRHRRLRLRAAALMLRRIAAMVPVSGSAYTYSYAVLGELIAWMVGWALILEYAVAAGAVSVGWSGYVNGFLSNGLGLPCATAGPRDTITLADGTMRAARSTCSRSCIVAAGHRLLRDRHLEEREGHRGAGDREDRRR